MNAQELTRLRQKAATRYIKGQTPVDSSLQTWKVQCRASAGASATPVMVANQTCAIGFNTYATGCGTSGDYTSVLMKNVGAAFSNNPTPETDPSGVLLPCFTYETRQRYALSNASGTIVDSNTYLNSLGSVGCSRCKGGGSRFSDGGTPITCSNATAAIYGGGIVAATTTSKTSSRIKMPSA